MCEIIYYRDLNGNFAAKKKQQFNNYEALLNDL